MSFCGYKYRFGLYAAHSNIVKAEAAESGTNGKDEIDENLHFHNFTINLYINRTNDKLDENFEVEKAVQDWLRPYHGQKLNQMELFLGRETTVEGIGNTFFDPLHDLINDLGYELVRLDIFENPIRVYSVSYKLLDSSVNEISSVPLECIPRFSDKRTENESEILNVYEILEVVEIPDLPDSEISGDISDISANKSSYITADTSADLKATESDDGAGKKKPKKASRLRSALRVLGSFFGLYCFFGMAVVTMYIVRVSGKYPQGSDTFCHLYRADLILKSIQAGNWYPLYDSSWYNGVEIMRYWGPVPLYIIAGLEWIAQRFVQGGVLDAYLLYIGAISFIGGCGWLLWGIRYKRISLSVVLGLIWFYLPENMRVVVYEGNLPRGVINALLPFFFYFLWRLIEDKKKNSMWPLLIVTSLITLCHLGITLMLIASVMIFLAFYSRINHSWKWAVFAFEAIVSGVLMAGIWVAPALIGGAASGSSTNQVMMSFFESATVSLDPMTRINGDSASFYFGLSVFVICLVGIIFGTRNVKSGFIIAIILFLCTTKSVYVLFSKLPFSQFLWMIRFIPIGLATAMFSFIMWKQLRKWMVLLFCVILIADCATSLQYIYYPGSDRSTNVQSDLEAKAERLLLTAAKETTTQRMALIDLSKYGSFAPYYLTGMGDGINYSFGAGWEGAATASNIVNLNSAAESGWYVYLFDRAVELGDDTVLVPIDCIKEKSKDVEILKKAAELNGYTLVRNSGGSLLFHKDTPKQFGVITEYSNLAIGDSAAGIAMIFPDFEEGSSNNINDYSFEELSRYDTIYLSGITYDSKTSAEELLLKLSESGVNVYIDMNSIPEDKAKRQMELFDVTSQSISFTDAYPEFEYKSTTYNMLDFSSDIGEWNTIYMNGLENVDGYCNMPGKSLPYIGTSKNKNLHFVGLNIVYYLQTTRDSEMKKLVESIFGTSENKLPVRRIVPVNIQAEKNRIVINTEYNDVNTTLSSLDIFSSGNDYRTINNLIVVDSGTTVITIGYPHIIRGLLVTLAGLILAVVTYIRILRIKEADDNENKDENKN